MQLIINITEHEKSVIDRYVDGHGYSYKDLTRTTVIESLAQAVHNGTPLPKGHGRIKDIDKIEWYGCNTEFDCPHEDRECKDCNRAKCSKTQVDAIPIIIEADRSEE